MFANLPDAATLVFLIVGAFGAGFVTGFAGFGTGLVASGFWYAAGRTDPVVTFAW